MLSWDLLMSPVVVIGMAFCAGVLIYGWSRMIAPVSVPGENKLMPYVGGEAAEAQVFRPGYQFFYIALFFTIVHVAALVLAMAPADAPLWGPLGYLLIMAVAVLILRWEQ